ncbi:MAG TPA: BadF/BadG/BcrA/BcrD ATPase family protein, partial [Ktedonobacteraceae bacterium]|nr:BadF/BadG/BcrA/BcrD ATPase family protein [Ktedonobacteraceae bacterium]
MSNSFALGVDGGGSKTLAILVDEQGNERGRGVAGSSNYSTVSLEQVHLNLRDAVEQAARAADCQLPVRAAWFGLAGMDRRDDYEILLPLLAPFAQNVHLVNDAELLLGALDNAVGVALIAGTGSIALGRDAYGTTTRAGGWG